MQVTIVHEDPRSAERWQRELQRRLPSARVTVWSEAEGAPDADYAVGWMAPPRFFETAPRLRAFFSAAAGVDHLLRHPGLPPTLPVLRLEDAGMARQMIEYCCHHVFGLYRRYDEYRAQQQRREWRELAPPPASQFRIGVLGLGVLGRAVAQALAGFGYPVCGYARSPKRVDGIATYAGPEGWPAFLAASDVLIVLAPLTPQTENLLDARSLSLLPRGAHVINVARGRLIVDEDLLALLDSGHLSGATLDVFRDEPLSPAHPFWSHPRIRITPHIAAMTVVDEAAAQVAAKIDQLERGERPGGWVDRQRGY